MFGGIGVLLILFYLWFFVATANINNFWGLFRGHQDEASASSWINNTALATPTLADVPEAINKKSFNLKGYAEPGLKANLFVNEIDKTQTVVDNTGTFSFDDISLESGSITVYVKVKNDTDKESGPSKAYTITYDDKAPKLDVKKPQDGDKFIDPSPFYTVEGSVNEDATIYVNDHVASLDYDKNFRLVVSVKEEDNFLKIKAVDKAGNETVVELKLVYEKP